MLMETWTKLYQRIIQSSVWKQPSDIRVVWITLLALKDEHGMVMGSAGWLAEQARVDPDLCRRALEIFKAPDPGSRTEANEGRKIADIGGGWVVLNHHLYRDGMDDQREKWRRQKAAQRAAMTPEQRARSERADKKVARLEAIQDKVRDKTNPGWREQSESRPAPDPSLAGTIQEKIKAMVDTDPITMADKESMERFQ